MKKILITGAGGFIGSHLAERCVELGYKVKAFVRYNSKNNWGWLENSAFGKEIDFIAGDIRDFDSVSAAMQGCAEVFHLAALIGIPYSYASPLAYIKTNVEGTYNVLESARKQNVENILITSTSETYGTAQYVPIDENHPLAGQSPYSASKIAADHLAISYHRSFGLPVKIVRPFNTYGPRQSARAIIPAVISQILAGKKEVAVGNISPTRDLTYVKDTVEGMLAVAGEKSLNGTVTNIGSGSEVSVEDIINRISGLMRIKIEIKGDPNRVRPEKSEVERLVCNNLRISQKTGWKIRHELNEGLAQTIDWMKKNIALYKEGYTI